eukprot:579751-Pyramimonas_sp.AAC.2
MEIQTVVSPVECDGIVPPINAPTDGWRDSQNALFQNKEPRDGRDATGLYVLWYDERDKAYAKTLGAPEFWPAVCTGLRDGCAFVTHRRYGAKAVWVGFGTREPRGAMCGCTRWRT